MEPISTIRDLTPRQLQQIVGGILHCSRPGDAGDLDKAIRRIELDIRRVCRGSVYWNVSKPGRAVPRLGQEAIARGACGIVNTTTTDAFTASPTAWQLQVSDAQASLERLACWGRERFRGTMIGVGGAIGKTTTRQMIRAALASRMIGCDIAAQDLDYQMLELACLEPERDFAVYELHGGAENSAKVCWQARPDIGVVTLGNGQFAASDYDSAATADVELLNGLRADGWAVLAGDDPRLRRRATGRARKTIWVGRSLDCDLVATHVEATSGHLRFRVDGVPICVPVWGRHYLDGALAALAVARIVGITLAEAAEGLADFQGPPQRCQVREFDGAKLIDDTYTSHPMTVRAALELLRDMDAPGRRIIVCGDLPDPDENGVLTHRELGDEVVTRCGADVLVACGEFAGEIADGATRAGMPSARVAAYREPEQALPHLRSLIEPGDVVLVKGARKQSMERIVHSLVAAADRRAA